jgi:hypothetical protein
MSGREYGGWQDLIHAPGHSTAPRGPTVLPRCPKASGQQHFALDGLYVRPAMARRGYGFILGIHA